MLEIISEKKICDDYLKKGYIVMKSNDIQCLNKIKNSLEKIIKRKTNIKSKDCFNNFHKHFKKKDLNTFRVSVISEINKIKNIKKLYYSLAKDYLDIIAGNELSIQKKLNLSIQLPNDPSSLLPLHSDTWSGDSPFEVVVWVPMVDCSKTKSMYILPPNKIDKLNRIFSKSQSTEKLFHLIKNDIEWIDIKYGEILIFNQNLPHGNIVNIEKETRWSFNCRFKSIFAPHGDKKIGEFFEPINIKPASKIGMIYKFPNTK